MTSVKVAEPISMTDECHSAHQGGASASTGIGTAAAGRVGLLLVVGAPSQTTPTPTHESTTLSPGTSFGSRLLSSAKLELILGLN